MSAEGAALEPPVAPGILTDARSRRVLRFGLGTTLASGLAYLIGFDLPFLVPILVAMLLASPAPCPSLRKGLAFVVPVAAGAFLGVVLTRYFLTYPGIFLLIEFAVLYRIFFALAGGAAPLRMVWLLIAALVIPLMGQASIGLSIGVAWGLIKGTVIAILAVWLSFGMLPDLPAEPSAGSGGLDARPARQVPPPAARAAYARRALIVLFPVLLLFFSLSLYSSAVILVYVGLLSLLPSFAAGWKQGKGMVTGNLIGGLVAIVFYNLLTVYPEFPIFLLLSLVVGLYFGDIILSDRPIAPVIKTAFNAVMLLVGTSLMGSGSEAASNFYVRIAQVMLAVVYVAAAFGFLEYLQRKRVKTS
jgi:hypothetical protein